jgi:hypothetical protein
VLLLLLDRPVGAAADPKKEVGDETLLVGLQSSLDVFQSLSVIQLLYAEDHDRVVQCQAGGPIGTSEATAAAAQSMDLALILERTADDTGGLHLAFCW